MKISVDPKFLDHFGGKLRQVFVYVTDECNLRCSQCYYKPWLKKWSPEAEMKFDVLSALLAQFRNLGAIKASFLGGEPTRYGILGGSNPRIPAVIRKARDEGFEYVRIVTNGLFPGSLLAEPDLKLLDEVTFSIDGDTPEIHDALRGRGTFRRTLQNVRNALDQGYTVHVTTCVHRLNSGRTSDGRLMLDRAIRWAEELGVALINFHPLFKMGIARDSWTEENDVSPALWQELYDEIHSKVAAGAYGIPVRIPQRFVTPQIFESDTAYFGYCPVKMAERLEVHVNGQMHSCALHNGTPITLARFSGDSDTLRIEWAEENNEIDRYDFDFSSHHPCVVMKRDFGARVPLCISFKPDQEEPVWRSLSIDAKRRGS